MSTKPPTVLRELWDGWYIAAGLKPKMTWPDRSLLTTRHADLLSLAKALKKYANRLRKGGPEQDWEERLANLLEELRRTSSPRRFRAQVNILINGIQRGNQQKIWHLRLPPPVTVIPRPLSPFTPESLSQSAAIPDLRKRFLTSIAETRHLSVEERIGQILASAILNGGLLNHKAVSAFIGLIPDQLRADRYQAWVDFPASTWSRRKQANSDSEAGDYLHRWIPDPLTQLLLLLGVEDDIWGKFRDSKAGLPPGTKPWTLLIRFYKRFPEEHGNQQIPYSNLRQFIKAAYIRAGLRIRPFLLEYARGAIASYSLPPHRFESARQNRRVISPQAPIETDLEHMSNDFDRPAPSAPSAVNPSQVDLYKKLTKAIYRRDKAQRSPERTVAINELLKNHGDEFFPLLRALAYWALWGLGYRENPRMQWRVPTVYRYVTALGKAFAAYVPNRPIPAIAPEEYLEIYDRVLDAPDRDLGSRLYALRRLRKFHNFLVHFFSAPPIDDEEWGDEGDPTGGHAVNLITFSEYHHAQNWLRTNLTGSQKKACQIVLILGFRCGFRRSECRSLRLRDIHLDCPEPYIEVENTLCNRLKSGSSRRRIPLLPFLTSSELSLIAGFTSGTDSSDILLFPSTTDKKRPVSHDKLFNPVHNALRQVTGDPAISFHTLRHAFANHTLALLLDTHPSKALELKGFNGAGNFDPAYAVEMLIGKGRTTKPALYALSNLMGHADPFTTLHHYVHTLDVLLANELKISFNELKIEVAKELLGNSASGLYRLSQSHERNQIAVDRLVQAYLRPLDHRSPYRGLEKSPRRKHLPATLIVDNDAAIDPRVIWDRVSTALTRCSTFEQLENAPRDIPEKYIVWARNALMISRLTNRRGRPRHSLIPTRPRMDADNSDCEKCWRYLLQLSGAKERRARWAVNWFLKTTSRTKHDARFTRPIDAARFCKFLADIGISRSRVLIIHYTNSSSTIAPESQVSRWQSEQLNTYAMKSGYDIPISAEKGRYGSIGIKVTHRIKRHIDPPPQGSYGFRYAMHTWVVINFSSFD